MQKIIFFSILLIFMLCSCSKEEITVSQNANQTDIYSEENLNALMSNGGLKSGLRFTIYARYSDTKTNYLLGAEPDHIPTEKAYNTDSLTNTTFKRYIDETVNIGGVLHGVFVVTNNFYDRPEETEICFTRDTSVNYFVKTNFTQNHAKGVSNVLVIERETNIPMMTYYDFTFSKWKLKGRYRLNSDSYGYREYLASRTLNGNTFRLAHQ